MHFSDDTADNMVIKNANINNIMKGMESTGGVRLHNHRRKLKQRFDIIRKLGQGTYGKVQLGINKETGQEVAIKTIKKAKIETEADLIRIRREIQIMSSVQHPNIIHIYEVFENREKMVLVMEYAAGGELYDYLNERKVLPEDEARRIFRQIATAVYYCHKHKICHRDLKLENILLDEQGSAKIADFGLSNVFDEQRLLNTFCGSPLYASPEIVKGTPYYGPEVDCWSLGVLLYTLVYGAMPFDGSNFKRLVKQISQGDYFEPKKTSPASSLIREMLTVAPAKRADIEKVCSHWWVNEGYSESCFEIAEELAGLTPVRLDLLLSLAPSPSGVSTENIMQQGLNILPTMPHSDVPVRCHSMGSLMDIGQSPNAQQKFVRKQSLFRNSEPEATTSKGATGASAKRKLDEGASLSDINMKGRMQDIQGEKRHQGMSSNGDSLPEGMQLTDDVLLNEQKHLKPDTGDQEMDIQNTDSTSLGAAMNSLEQNQSKVSPKESDSRTGEKSLNEESAPTGESSGGAVVSENSSLGGVVPVSNEQVARDINVSNKDVLTKENTQRTAKIKHEADNIVSKDVSEKGVKTDEDTSLQESPAVSKDPLKTLERKRDKQKKPGGSDKSVDTAKSSRTPRVTDSSLNKNDIKMIEDSVCTKSEALLEDNVCSQKSNPVLLKEKHDMLQKSEDLNSSSAESAPRPTNIKDQQPKSAQSAENLNNISLNSESKTGTKEKPKRLFIPGVKVSDFKKAFERKLSSPEISAISFVKKPFTKSSHNLSVKSDDSVTNNKNSEIQKNMGPNETKQAADNTAHKMSDIQAAATSINNEAVKEPSNTGTVQKASVISKSVESNSSTDAEVVQGNTTAEEGNVDKASCDIPANRVRKENIANSDKVKSVKVIRDSNKIKPAASSKLRGSPLDGKSSQNTIQQPGSPKELQSNVPNSSILDESNVTNETGSAEYSPRIPESSIPEEAKVPATAQSKSVDSTGNKKRSKVEITLKSATLPRRKTSKAEIKLDPAVPPIEYKTEIEHMVSPPPVSLPENRSVDDKSAFGKIQSFRSWSLEPEGTPHQQLSTSECIIPIQIENRMNENRNLASPTSARPPMYPFQQRSLSQTQRTRNLSHQNTQESDSGETEKIKKSPREYIIPIAVEGGGYVTPRATSLEPTSRDDFRSSTSSRTNHYRRMSSLLSDTSEDEGLNMPPMGLQRLSSLSRDRDEGRNFHFHRLRSSRPMRNSLERNDSLSSAEEDDDDDEGFEILTAESLFSTLLSRVRSLTQRLTVEDAKMSGLPQNHFVNQLSSISNPSRPWRKFYEFRREPLSRRLSETSFSRLSSFDGERGLQNDSGLSRDSSIGTDVDTGSSCSVRTLPRGSSNHYCDQSDAVRRGTTRLSNPPLPTFDAKKVGMRQEEYGMNTECKCSESFPRKNSTRKSVLPTGSDSFQSNNLYTPRKLFRTRSLRSTDEDKGLINSPHEKSHQGKYLKNTAFRNNNIDKLSALDSSFRTASDYQKNGTQKHTDMFSSNFLPDNLPLSSSRVARSNLSGSCSTLLSRDVSPKIQKDLSYPKVHPYEESRKISLPRVTEAQKSSAQKTNEMKFLSNSSKPMLKKLSGGNTEKVGSIERSMSQQTTNLSKFYNKPNDPKTTSLKLKENKSASALCIPEQLPLNKPSSVKENNNKYSKSKLLQNYRQCHTEHENASGTIKKTTLNTKHKANTSAVPDTSEPCGPLSQERRKSRFLRPDFFDTPPEESSYVKEREDKKAAEAELKQARRLSRRASFKESYSRKTNTDDNKTIIGNPSEINNNKNQNIHPENSETITHSTDLDLNPCSTRISNMRHSYCQRSPTSNINVDEKANDTSPRKRENFGTTNQAFTPPTCRMEKNIQPSRENGSSSLDMKTIATESTYLKRAVSVDDVSFLDKGSFSRNNAKGARKINSVLRLFSKSDNQNKNSHDNSPKSFFSTNNLNKNNNYSGSQQELRKEADVFFLRKANNSTTGKIKQSHSAHIISSENVNSSTDFKRNDPSKLNTFNTEDRNNSYYVRSIPGAISQPQYDAGKAKGKELSRRDGGKKHITTNTQIAHPQTSVKPGEKGSISIMKENVQQLFDSSNKCVEYSNALNPNSEADIDCKQVESLSTDNNQILESTSAVENSDSHTKLDDSENISPSCSSICATDNPSLTDENEKDSESVEDRIRRKSFYTRFNDVKKKVRKKSPQFLMENRANPIPGNVHKTQENQQLATQINPGEEEEKSADLLDYVKNQIHSSEFSDNSHANNEKSPLLQKAQEVAVTKYNKEEKSDIVRSTSNESTSNLTLLRPAAFVRNVLDKTCTKVTNPSQNEIHDLSISVDHSENEIKH